MSTELGVSGNPAGSPFQQVFHRFCSLHLQATGSYQCQEKCPGIECDMDQQGAPTSVNDSPLSKQSYRQHCPSLLPGTSVTSGKQRLSFPIWKIDLIICEYEESDLGLKL